MQRDHRRADVTVNPCQVGFAAQLPASAIENHRALDGVAGGDQLAFESEAKQSLHAVGRQGDAGTCGRERGGALEANHVDAATVQGGRERESSDAGTGYNDVRYHAVVQASTGERRNRG